MTRAEEIKLMVTLVPSFSHFKDFCCDDRLSGIRLNCATLEPEMIQNEMALLPGLTPTVPLYYDLKGRQLRVEEVHENPDYLDITLNHAISVSTPAEVFFKGGEDGVILERLEEAGRRLIFRGGPQYQIGKGESLHILSPDLKIHEPYFTTAELEKIEIVKRFGFKKYFVSYVHSQRYIDQVLEIVGQDAELILKIEDEKGLEFVAREFRKRDNLRLAAARGDLYVELNPAHRIIKAMRLIAQKDPEAIAGSRVLLSVAQQLVPPKTLGHMNTIRDILEDVLSAKIGIEEAQQKYVSSEAFIPRPKEAFPSCADFSELAWIFDIGYRNVLLCDDLCIFGDLLSIAVNVFDDFRLDWEGGK